MKSKLKRKRYLKGEMFVLKVLSRNFRVLNVSRDFLLNQNARLHKSFSPLSKICSPESSPVKVTTLKKKRRISSSSEDDNESAAPSGSKK